MVCSSFFVSILTESRLICESCNLETICGETIHFSKSLNVFCNETLQWCNALRWLEGPITWHESGNVFPIILVFLHSDESSIAWNASDKFSLSFWYFSPRMKVLYVTTYVRRVSQSFSLMPKCNQDGKTPDKHHWISTHWASLKDRSSFFFVIRLFNSITFCAF